VFRKDWVLGVPVAILTLALAAFLRWPLPIVLLLTAGTGSAVAWARRLSSSSEAVAREETR